MNQLTQPQQFICDDGLCEEDRIAIAMDEASELNAGKLVNGICVCGANYSQVIGKVWCDWCAEGY